MYMCTITVIDHLAKLMTKFAYFLVKIDKLARDPPSNPDK